MRANERAVGFTGIFGKRRNTASVAIDGYCARKNAERMLVRRKSGS